MAIDDLAVRYPTRARLWQLRTRTLQLPRVPLVMGIVNVTPDSFSDGGQYFDTDRAIQHGLELAASGANLLDIGGESTRPYATPVEASEELRRTESVVRELARRTSLPISIDTSKAVVAEAALAAGAEIVNDVTALTGDPAMLPLLSRTAAGICLMHMQGTPSTMQVAPSYTQLIPEIHDYLAARVAACEESGIARERLCIDPGVGFGKTHQHNISLVARCASFHELGIPLLVGASRKGFIGKLLGDSQRDRTWGSVGVALALARLGVQIIRVHDVQATRDALELFAAVGGIDGRERKL